jgi:colanic acid/amylovoran biosynthesis glycosyltransferase
MRSLQEEASARGCSPMLSLSSGSLLINQRWDIIHAHFLNALSSFVGLRRLISCPVVASVYGCDVSILPHQAGGIEQLKSCVSQVDGLTYSSQFLRQGLHALCEVSVPEEVIAPEVPIERFQAEIRKRPGDPLRLLAVGRLHWSKGYPTLLAAMRKLLDGGMQVHADIIGEGPARSEIEYLIRSLSLNECVTLHGACTPETVAKMMHAADLFVSSSIREDFGLALIEAQASGLPLVATKIGGVPEAVRDEETGILVPPLDPAAIADAVRLLSTNHSLYEKMSRCGPPHASQFDVDLIGGRLERFYDRIIREYHLAPRS